MSDIKFRFGLIKCSNGEAVPEDEPVFILRARDRYALQTLLFYDNVTRHLNAYHRGGMGDMIVAFEHFRAMHPERMKDPGVTEGK